MGKLSKRDGPVEKVQQRKNRTLRKNVSYVDDILVDGPEQAEVETLKQQDHAEFPGKLPAQFRKGMVSLGRTRGGRFLLQGRAVNVLDHGYVHL